MKNYITSNKDCNNVLNEIIENYVDKLKDIIKSDTKIEIYYHDDVHEFVDSAISNMTRKELMAVIDDTNNEDQVESELINKSSLDTILESLAYGCMETEIYDTDIMQYLQEELNNETIDKNKAKTILKNLKDENFKWGDQDES